MRKRPIRLVNLRPNCAKSIFIQYRSLNLTGRFNSLLHTAESGFLDSMNGRKLNGIRSSSTRTFRAESAQADFAIRRSELTRPVLGRRTS